MVAKLDLTGSTFGNWTVLAAAGSKDGKTTWTCRCVCGTEKVVGGASLRCGQSKSCGCGRAAENRRRTKHGMKSTPEYHAWTAMRSRCRDVNHPAYENYGGRGIAVCAEWDSFPAFLAAVGRRPSDDHSLDRIENDKGYEPGNVRWATPSEQNANKRMTPKMIEHQRAAGRLGGAASQRARRVAVAS